VGSVTRSADEKEITMRRELTRDQPHPIEAARGALVRDLMTRDPVTITADTGLEQVIEVFLSRGMSHLPVVDEDGRAIGMVSKTDLVRDAHVRGDTEVSQEPGTKARGIRYIEADAHVHEVGGLARDVMTPIAVSLPETASVADAAHVIASGQLHAVLIAGDDGRVVGLVSSVDIAAWVAGISARPEWRGTR